MWVEAYRGGSYMRNEFRFEMITAKEQEPTEQSTCHKPTTSNCGW